MGEIKILGVDKFDRSIVYGYDPATSIFYRARNAGLAGLGAIAWEAIFSGINNNPLLQALGARISGGSPFNLQMNPALAPGYNYSVGGPGLFGSINPMYLLLGGGLALFLLMRR